MTSLDFDGDYGRTYDISIRTTIPAYDAILEIGAACLTALLPEARSALVVGPGTGAELPALLRALPQATFTLVEPSARMREAAARHLAGCEERVRWIAAPLEEAEELGPQRFEAVIAQNVVHLFAAEGQERLLRLLSARVAPAGLLLLSSYCETPPPGLDAAGLDDLIAIALTRWRALGADEARIAQILAVRGTAVVSLEVERLERLLAEAGMEPPVQLVQVLLNRLWYSRRPGDT